jgi:hypothetical protein
MTPKKFCDIKYLIFVQGLSGDGTLHTLLYTHLRFEIFKTPRVQIQLSAIPKTLYTVGLYLHEV